MIVIPKLQRTCWACPAQWEGLTITGDNVYIRYRYGILRVDINRETNFCDEIGDDLDGVLDFNKLKSILEKQSIILGTEIEL